jgi:hypothetical protein
MNACKNQSTMPSVYGFVSTYIGAIYGSAGIVGVQKSSSLLPIVLQMLATHCVTRAQREQQQA